MGTKWRSTLGFFIFYSTWLGSVVFVAISALSIVMFPSFRAPVVIFYALYFAVMTLLPWGRWERFCDGVRWFNIKTPYFEEQKLVFQDPDNNKACPAKSKALLAYHPHGILVCGWTVNGAAHTTWKDSAISWLGTDALFILPFIAQIMYWAGGGAANRSNFESLAKAGENIALLPGGFEEASLFRYKTHQVFIKQRKGFIKLGMQYGYKVHPVYTFGEENTYWTLPYFQEIRLFLNRYKIPAVVFWGRWWCPYMPYNNSKLVTVVGKPIQLPQIAKPTKEDVDKYHNLYMESLQALFDEFKGQYAADPNATLTML
ncbi:hypothetical protein AeNC1_008976 [Aphanomyces euteiches]|nr:hypothetical protein AeNC1_008976 [Aphanomyces euteiches]